MIDIEHANAYCEVLEILKNIEEDDYLKIPQEKIEVFKEFSNKEYDFKFDPNKSLDEQNVSEIARTVLAILFRDYIATEEQKRKILNYQKKAEKILEAEKREKYSYENLFKNNKPTLLQDDTIEKETEDKNNDNQLTVYKESIWKKMINKIKNILKR